MAYIPYRLDLNSAKHATPYRITFSILTSEQIRKMAVCKISTSKTLDAMDHPIAGGLYDPRMGPLSDRSDPCATCNRNIFECPGHIGYVDLSLPVVNPIFHNIVGTLMRISCLSCHHIQIPLHIKHSIVIQLKLLNCGLICEAQDVETMILGLISTHGSLEEIPEDASLPIKEYEKMANENQGTNERFSSNKNTEKLRNECITYLFSRVKPRKTCLFCKAKMERIQALKSKVILSKKVEMSESIERLNTSGRGVVTYEPRFVTPDESKNYLRQFWVEEKELVQHIAPVLCGIDSDYPTDAFYMDVLTIVPPISRLPNYVDGRMSEHSQTKNYKSIIMANLVLNTIMKVMKDGGETESLIQEAKDVYNDAHGSSPVEKLSNAWEGLQTQVDYLLDKEATKNKEIYRGFKQRLEKKEGIIRMHMMGKRVNYAARSVIAPDPYLKVDEIGVPEVIAKKLTYPTPVTPFNVQEMRKLVMNGPNVHPGANQVEMENGSIVWLSGKDERQRESIQKRLLTPDDSKIGFTGVKKVYRHLSNGDAVLMNRQPTLHRPSIQAHKVKVLKDEQTLRLHYSNCKAYNADFDGDEMNMHVPQNELARSEARYLANVSNNYLGPKDGTPLGGIIQDHVIAGVKLTMRGTFFNKMDYDQIVYQGLDYTTRHIRTLPPAIIAPKQLWTGKQVFSTVLMNILPEDLPGINLEGFIKISDQTWIIEESRPWKAGGTPFKNAKTMSESEVVIRNAELLVGVLDKTHYGATPYGLVHCVYELYGGNYAMRLLSSLSKVFTYCLQKFGFTLGVEDLLLVEEAEKMRKKLLKKTRKIGVDVVTETLGIPIDTPRDEIVEKLEEAMFKNPNFKAILDRAYKNKLDPFINAINQACLPKGLLRKFPVNNLQLMVMSGAKGSMVNAMQMSCLLGQIELEGKRPPLMINGRSLPSFPIFDFSPRAGGFIEGRFLTGINPQEFFFHCMAGREGLIDTAVKTSRSGYLQRCLIKHLEGLTVRYDMTVRDSDNTVIQFLYGEDGMDVTKSQFLNKKQAKFLCDNSKVILNKNTLKQLKDDEKQPEIKQHGENIDEWLKSKQHNRNKSGPFSMFSRHVTETYPDKKFTNDMLIRLWRTVEEPIREPFVSAYYKCPDPLNAVFQPDAHFGALSDKLRDLITTVQDDLTTKKEKRDYKNIVQLKSMQAMAAPGDPVGLLAAQSVGEPSTQMTLNTFHFAGRGEMNVTLGIPRLREILMMASKNISTPSMQIPFLDIPDVEEQSAKLKRQLTRVVTWDVLLSLDMKRRLQLVPIPQKIITIRYTFLPPDCYKHKYALKPKQIIRHMKNKYFSELFAAIKKHSKLCRPFVLIEREKKPARRRKKGKEDDEEENEASNEPDNTANVSEDSSDEEPQDIEDAKMSRRHVNKNQEPEEEENEDSDDEVAAVDQAENNAEKKEEEEEDNEYITTSTEIQNFTYDKENRSWCEVTFGVPLNMKKNVFDELLRQVTKSCVITEVRNIKNAIITNINGKLTLQTEGVNIPAMLKYYKLLDLNKIYCNDIHKIAETYGIEAAGIAIVKEVKDVFNVYGIPVDTRHLSLIASYMTSTGSYLPLNKKGMECSSSPLQQMSFESAMTSLKSAVLRGKQDDLQNPSSCLMLGKACQTGTGVCRCLVKLL